MYWWVSVLLLPLVFRISCSVTRWKPSPRSALLVPALPLLLFMEHIHYEFAIPPLVKKLILVFGILYIMAAIITPLISSIKKMKWLSIVFFGSYIFAVSFYHGFVISVCCFFAALLSFVVLRIISNLRNKTLQGFATLGAFYFALNKFSHFRLGNLP